VDNALDEARGCVLSLWDGVATVEDKGAGIDGDDAEIARIFSMDRPQISSKYLRLPTRGALGNGLRVVVGAVAATDGMLIVTTRGRSLRIIPDRATGTSRVERVEGEPCEGTRIELRLGHQLRLASSALEMGQTAIAAAQGANSPYRGKTSPHWYDAESFHELLLSIVDDTMTVHAFIKKHFDGCSHIAKNIAGRFSGMPAKSLSRPEATELLRRAQAMAPEVNPGRLGRTEEYTFPGAYARATDTVTMPGREGEPTARLPVVAEAWVEILREGDAASALILVNGSPCIADIRIKHEPKSRVTALWGFGATFVINTRKEPVRVHLNVIVPAMPITTDGKAPDVSYFRTVIQSALDKAWSRAKRARPKGPKIDRLKDVVFRHMDEQIRIVSCDRKYRFNCLQVYYRMRPIVMEKTGRSLDWDYFSQTLVKQYQEERGEEPMAYRDPRGSFYMPHCKESIPLGTLEVEKYRRPEYTFNKILAIEKEGFMQALIADGFPERHGCALLTSKGQPTDAARDLIDLIGATDEPVQVFLLHDCDAAGTLIYQAFQDATATKQGRSVEIVNLGLDVPEAMSLEHQGLVEVEYVDREKGQPVADYVETDDAEWLQSHRVELNAFTTAEFIKWLDGKMEKHKDKVVPPADHMAGRLREGIRQRLREEISASVLAEAKIDERVEDALAGFSGAIGEAEAALLGSVVSALESEPGQHWTEPIDAAADRVAARHREKPKRGRKAGLEAKD
jgi:hypothetical protein